MLLIISIANETFLCDALYIANVTVFILCVLIGQGPLIPNPIRSEQDIDRLISIEDVETQVPFITPILQVGWFFASKI
jgi:hypothetical protein